MDRDYWHSFLRVEFKEQKCCFLNFKRMPETTQKEIMIYGVSNNDDDDDDDNNNNSKK